MPLIDYHNQRFNRTRQHFFPNTTAIKLQDQISVPADLANALVKCRIVYSAEIQTIEYIPYAPKQIDSIQIVPSSISYAWKYSDRSALDAAFQLKGTADDILLVKDGWVSDTHYCNVALWKNGLWFTPKEPLLAGTMREKLLEDGVILLADIPSSGINYYDKICLFNAMIDFEQIVLPIDKILPHYETDSHCTTII